MIMLIITALFIPFATANMLATIYDVTAPEIRSTANAVESFIESGGAVLSPVIVGVIANTYSLKDDFLIICLSAWALCAFFFFFKAYLIPRDTKKLRSQMRERADQERELQSASPLEAQ